MLRCASRLTSPFLVLLVGVLAARAIAADTEDTAHRVPRGAATGVRVEVAQTVLIQPDADYPVVSQFADGRIAVGWGNYNPRAGRWSHDGGRTWRDGPAPPDEACVELG